MNIVCIQSQSFSISTAQAPAAALLSFPSIHIHISTYIYFCRSYLLVFLCVVCVWNSKNCIFIIEFKFHFLHHCIDCTIAFLISSAKRMIFFRQFLYSVRCVLCVFRMPSRLLPFNLTKSFFFYWILGFLLSLLSTPALTSTRSIRMPTSNPFTFGVCLCVWIKPNKFPIIYIY